MKEERILNVLGQVDEKYIEEATIEKKAKKNSWIKWIAIAACFAIVFIGVNVGSNFFWKTGCGQTSHNITLMDGKVYYTCMNDGLYVYDQESEVSNKLAKSSGILLKTHEGLVLYDTTTGIVYSVEQNKLTEITTIPDSTVFDMIADNLYYRTYTDNIGYDIVEENLRTGECSVLLSVANGHITAQKIIGDKLYYSTTENEGMIFAFDMQSKDNTVLYNSPFNSVSFYDDFALIEDEQGLSMLEYTNADVDFLCKYVPTTGALDYYKGKLYFAISICVDSNENYEESLIALDVKTKEITTVAVLTNENGTVKTYTEIVVCDTGYYYTEPSATIGGLFYHSFDGISEITICKN